MRIAPSFWATLLAVCGCAAVERVSVGSMERGIDFSRCTGEGLICDAEQDREVWQPKQSDVEEVRECQPVEEPMPWRVAWMRRVSALDCGEFGTCGAKMRAFAPDGSAWIADLKVTAPEQSGERKLGVFLGHYAPNGDVLVEEIVDSWNVRTPDIALDDASLVIAASASGHAAVVVSWLREDDDAEGRIAVYDSGGERVGGPVELKGLQSDVRLSVAIDRDESVFVLAGNTTTSWDGRATTEPMSGRGALAKLSSSLELQWLQSVTVPGPVHVVTAGGEPALITSSGATPDELRSGMAWYDSHGRLQKQLTLAHGQELVRQRLDDGVLIGDFRRARDVLFRAIAAAGNVRWAVRMLSESSLGESSKLEGAWCTAVARDPDGALYHFFRGGALNHIARLHASRTTCSFARIENLSADTDLHCIAMDERGGLYVEGRNTQDKVRLLGKLER